MGLAFLALAIAAVMAFGWLGAFRRRRRVTESVAVGMRCTVGPPPDGFD